jgi:membrane-associated phospholipid phosphatase
LNWAAVFSKLGNSGLLLPFSVFLACLLWRYESRRASIYLLAAVGACAAATLALKVVFLACGAAWGSSIATPSAHASMSAVVYGAMAAVSTRRMSRWGRLSFVSLTGLLIGAIALSRIALHAHSPEEIILGLCVGITAAGVFAYCYARLPLQNPIKRRILLLGSAVILSALYGVYIPFEELAYDLALRSRTAFQICPMQ